MVKLIRQGVYYAEDRLVKESQAFMTSDKKEAAIENTVIRRLLAEHNQGDESDLKLRFDRIAVGEKSYYNLLRAAEGAGLSAFPVPVTLFGGKGPREFALSAAKRYGGEFVPENSADPSVYLCERRVRTGELLLTCDNLPCGVGALGAAAFRDDEGMILRQLFSKTYDLPRPETVGVYLKGKLQKGVGATDVVLSVIASAGRELKGKFLELFGPGVSSLTVEQRMSVDRALYATGCLSSVWETDGKTEEYFRAQGREGFKAVSPVQPAYYDFGVTVDLGRIVSMCRVDGRIRTVTDVIRKKDVDGSLLKNGKVFLPYLSFGASSGGYAKFAELAEALRGKKIGAETEVFAYMPSQSVFAALTENGYLLPLIEAGVNIEASAPVSGRVRDGWWVEGDIFDPLTLIATVLNEGYLATPAGFERAKRVKKPVYHAGFYENRVYDGLNEPQVGALLAYDGELLAPLPALPPLEEDLTLTINGDEGEIALLHSGELYPWGQIGEEREFGIRAVVAKEFAPVLKRRLIDWGMLPLVYTKPELREGDVLRLSGIASLIGSGEERILAKLERENGKKDIVLTLDLTEEERKTLLVGGSCNLIRGE